jgi:GDP-L-fucose synthase
MVGSAIVRALERHAFDNLLLADVQEIDMRDCDAVADFFARERPQLVVLAAARVGGIKANIEHAAEFLYDNLMIQNNVIHHAHQSGIEKLLFLGSSCVYPRQCPQPMKEEYLLGGPLEPTNEGYAVAKIAGLKLVEMYRRQYRFPGISVMPCNLYGTGDHFDPEVAHVLSALVRRFVDATLDGDDTVTVWGTGTARREFMHVDDLAEAVLFMLERYDDAGFVNIGWGEDVSIRELAELIASRSGFTGRIAWDRTKPDGMPRKCLDVSRMRALGFAPQITLEQGVDRTIAEYREIRSGGEGSR